MPDLPFTVSRLSQNDSTIIFQMKNLRTYTILCLRCMFKTTTLHCIFMQVRFCTHIRSQTLISTTEIKVSIKLIMANEVCVSK